MNLNELKHNVLAGETITKEQAMELYQMPLEALCNAANEIRDYFCNNAFDLCTIINAKSGRCSENCKYCAQSAFYQTEVEEYPLLSKDEILRQAKYNEERGVLRYSIVTSGRDLSDAEVDLVCESVRIIKEETNIEVCVSLGLLKEEEFARLKEAGVSRIHNNLETSRSNFPNVCTTHTYDDKIAAIKAAKRAGLDVCSGGIMGLGETIEDRIDLAITIRELGVKSFPVNMLNPILGTPYENEKRLDVDEMRRIVAVYRFLLPDALIRLAGGRGLLDDKGRACFLSGANAAITGDMLTRPGISIEKDRKILKELNYKVALSGANDVATSDAG